MSETNGAQKPDPADRFRGMFPIVGGASGVIAVFGFLYTEIADIKNGRVKNAGDIVALRASVIEGETQHRCGRTVDNLEHQMQEFLNYYISRCPAVVPPVRSYWPPAPGPEGPGGAASSHGN